MTEQTTIERMSSGDGHWFALADSDARRFIRMATEIRQVYTVDDKRIIERLDEAGILSLLASGIVVSYGSDWYERLRQAPEAPSAEEQAARDAAMSALYADAEYCERRP